MKQRNKLGRSSMRKGYNLREKHSWYSKQCVQRPWGRITISTQCLWAARWSHWLERSEWQGSIGVEIREVIGSQVKYHGTHALLISASLTGLIPLNYRSILKFYGLSSPLPGGLLLTLMLLIPTSGQWKNETRRSDLAPDSPEDTLRSKEGIGYVRHSMYSIRHWEKILRAPI